MECPEEDLYEVLIYLKNPTLFSPDESDPRLRGEINDIIERYCGDSNPRASFREHVLGCNDCLSSYREFVRFLYDTTDKLHSVLTLQRFNSPQKPKERIFIDERIKLNKEMLNLPLELII